jgi:preprotein translocase subunit SecE
MKFEVYKKGQGKYTRLCSGFAAGAIVILGCLQLYRKLEATDMNPWVETMVPAGLFVILAILVFWIVNKPRIADFMISAEGEMKKVSWSSRRDIAISTFIVIVVVAFMAGLLFVIDLVFRMFFDWLLL